jgi:hypothetical protein
MRLGIRFDAAGSLRAEGGLALRYDMMDMYVSEKTVYTASLLY